MELEDDVLSILFLKFRLDIIASGFDLPPISHQSTESVVVKIRRKTICMNIFSNPPYLNHISSKFQPFGTSLSGFYDYFLYFVLDDLYSTRFHARRFDSTYKLDFQKEIDTPKSFISFRYAFKLLIVVFSPGDLIFIVVSCLVLENLNGFLFHVTI